MCDRTHNGVGVLSLYRLTGQSKQTTFFNSKESWNLVRKTSGCAETGIRWLYRLIFGAFVATYIKGVGFGL